MNIFRLLGDLSHLLAIIILLQKIWKTRSCAGISVTILFIRLHLSLSCHRSWNFALLFVHCNRALNTCNENEFSLLSTPVTFYLTVLKFIFRFGTTYFFLAFSFTKTNIELSEPVFKIRLPSVNFGFRKDSMSSKDYTFWGLSKLYLSIFALSLDLSQVCLWKWVGRPG